MAGLLHIPGMCEEATPLRIDFLGAADLDQVLAIESASFPRPWTRQHFLDELASPHARLLAARTADGTLVGYLCLRILFDEAEILDVAVDPAQRRFGAGRQLVAAAFAVCRTQSLHTLGLEVRISNQPAIALYRAFGFQDSGIRRRYYENGEDALLMTYDFTKEEGHHAV